MVAVLLGACVRRGARVPVLLFRAAAAPEAWCPPLPDVAPATEEPTPNEKVATMPMAATTANLPLALISVSYTA